MGKDAGRDSRGLWWDLQVYVWVVTSDILYALSGDRTVKRVPQTVLQMFLSITKVWQDSNWHLQCRVCECVVSRSYLSVLFMLSGQFYNLAMWPAWLARQRKERWSMFSVQGAPLWNLNMYRLINSLNAKLLRGGVHHTLRSSVSVTG